MAWRLEWVSGEVDRLWPEGVPQIRNEHGSAYVTGYAHDDAGNRPQLRWGVYLGMFGHKTVLDSIRATVQVRQGKKLFLQSRPVYPLANHYCQTWQHLPDYGAYHGTLIADTALPGKCQPGAKWFCWAMLKSRLQHSLHRASALARQTGQEIVLPCFLD